MRFVLALLLVAAVAVVVFYELEPLRLEYRRSLAEENRLKQQLKLVRDENELLKREIMRMKSDPFYIEKYARDAFGLAKSNETVYKFDK